MNHIIVENLVKTYPITQKRGGFFGGIKDLFFPVQKEYQAVANISFSVKKGEKIAFLGPNGAGKSTTIKILVGILHPSSGVVKVAGCNPSTERDILLNNIGVVFGQISRLSYHLSPKDTYELFQKLYNVPQKEFEERLRWLLDIFDANEFVSRPVRKLSLGQRMRAEIVASLIYKPEILFLDEPTIGLDFMAKERFRECINQINKEWGTTIFLTSHDMGDVDHICDRIVVINGGEICFDGDLNNLKNTALTHQIVKIRTNSHITAIPEMSIKASNFPGELVFEVEKNPQILQKVLSHVSAYDIENLTMENPETEFLIREIYVKGKKH